MEPTQQAPVTNDEKISAFAKVAREAITSDDPNVGQEDEGLLTESPQETEVEQQTEGEAEAAEEVEQEADEATPAETEIPMVEVELEDGKKVTIPEELKGYVMRDKDYRQKTMALAEQRKSYEQLSQQAQQIATQAQQLAPYHAQLYAMDNRAQQLERDLTSELAANDPIEYNRKQGELAILLRNRDSLAGGLHQQMAVLNQQQAELRTQKLMVEAPKLFEEIPELNKPEERESLGKWVRDQGLSDFEIDHMNFSTAATKMAWKAKQFDRMVKEQAKAKTELKTKVQSLPTATKSSRAPDNGAQTKQLRQDWKKGGGKIHDPNFSSLLRSRLGIK
jgi:hypothetical protein